jgi:hypothetical protein
MRTDCCVPFSFSFVGLFFPSSTWAYEIVYPYRQRTDGLWGKLGRSACHLFCVCQVSSAGIVMCDQKTVNRVT